MRHSGNYLAVSSHLAGSWLLLQLGHEAKTPPRNIQKHLIDIWSGQRKCIIVLDDTDLQMMTDIFENKQRFPYEVITKKYSEFMRKCPT